MLVTNVVIGTSINQHLNLIAIYPSKVTFEGDTPRYYRYIILKYAIREAYSIKLRFSDYLNIISVFVVLQFLYDLNIA